MRYLRIFQLHNRKLTGSIFVFADAPFILQSSAKLIRTNASSTVKLFCGIQSNPPASTHWKVSSQRLNPLSYPNTTAVEFATPQHSTVKTELTILNSTRFDNGLFSCAANNSLGMVSWNMTLVVYCKLGVGSL